MNLFLAVFIIVNLLLVGKWQATQRYRAQVRESIQEMKAAMDAARCEIGEILLPVFFDTAKVMNAFIVAARNAAEAMSE